MTTTDSASVTTIEAAAQSAVAASGAPLVAFQADTKVLWWSGSNRHQGMMAGTSPAMITVPGGHQSAFQANTGELVVYGDQLTVNTRKKMAAHTSPALVRMKDGRLVVAYHGSNGHLWLWSSTGGDQDLGVAIKQNTSPSIAATANGSGYRVAFQSTTTSLAFHDSSAGIMRTELGMAADSSPDIAYVADRFWTAFQANTHNLWMHDGSRGANMKLGMHPKTSPSIASVGGGYRVAFQANTGSLWEFDGKAGSDLKLGMDPASSPSIGATPGGYAIAFQADVHSLWVWRSESRKGSGQRLGMYPGTSPALGSSAAAATPGSSAGVTMAQLKAIWGSKVSDSPSVVDGLPGLNAAMTEFAITTPARKAAFLATLLNESSLHYDIVQRLSVPYTGRGYIQLTGGDGGRTPGNYATASKALGVDFVNQPELAASKQWSARIAAWYWRGGAGPEVDLNPAADNLDMGLVSFQIGYKADIAEDDERCADFKAALRYFNGGTLPSGTITCRRHR